MSEQLLREKFIKYTKSNGIKFNFIAKGMGISQSTISHFVTGDRVIGKYVIQLVEDYLADKKI